MRLLTPSSSAMLSAFPWLVTAAPTPNANTTLAVHNITRFASFSFENLAVRSNDQILVTVLEPHAQIYQIDPRQITPPILVHDFSPVAQHLTGITESTTREDVFYVMAGNYSLTDATVRIPSSMALFEVDMHASRVTANDTTVAPSVVRKAASVPQILLPNGIAASSCEHEKIYIADSIAGVIWLVDLRNGDVVVAVNDSSTAAPVGTIGVNGVKVAMGQLWYTNTGTSSVFKVEVDPSTGAVRGNAAPIVVARNVSCDDLVVDERDGTIFVAGSPGNVVTKITPDGQVAVIAGVFGSSESPLQGPTAAAFGRARADWRSLYVTTNGGDAVPINGTQGVSRLDLARPISGP